MAKIWFKVQDIPENTRREVLDSLREKMGDTEELSPFTYSHFQVAYAWSVDSSPGSRNHVRYIPFDDGVPDCPEVDLIFLGGTNET